MSPGQEMDKHYWRPIQLEGLPPFCRHCELSRAGHIELTNPEVDNMIDNAFEDPTAYSVVPGGDITGFTTSSGAVYKISHNKQGVYIRRENQHSDTVKRADNEWIRLLDFPEIHIGSSVILRVESLGGRGPDDHGHEGITDFTTRITTPVLSIVRNGGSFA